LRASDFEPGLAVVQSNRPEDLRQVVVEHVRRQPLSPLEREVVLVQSMGAARWLQQGLALDPRTEGGGLGVCASVEFKLPARFMWEAYRAVLDPESLPDESPFDADRLRWRIYRVLGAGIADPKYAALHRFLDADDDPRRRDQLAVALAELFEAYQFYRADWLADWEDGRDRLRRFGAPEVPVPDDQVWQPELWRALVANRGDDGGGRHRGRLHRDFVAALERAAQRPAGLPRRLIVFGISSLPAQTLQALAAIARHCQVLVCLHNPCRWYWGNLVAERDEVRRWGSRFERKPETPDRELTDIELGQQANPLLASWGRQGRDFIALLDEFDRPEHYRDWFDQRINLFSDFATGPDDALLRQLQQRILDLEPAPAANERVPLAAEDDSIAFAVAHSRQREVEILHDRLLDAMQHDPDLQPRDIIVMVPDIDAYAPHVEAVFGNLAGPDDDLSNDGSDDSSGSRADRRFIPYTIGDRNERLRSPLLRAIDELLALPRARLASTEVLDLLRVPALARRFKIDEAGVERAGRWLEQAGVRWGLDADHRGELLGASAGFDQNSWQFGLDRMLLGYAVGCAEPFADIVPFDEVTPGTADLAARLAALVERLKHWREVLARPATAADWAARLRALIGELFDLDADADALDRHRFDEALDALVRDVERAGLDEPLPLEVVRDALNARLDRDGLSRRFLAGRVNFSTLMPMRAIPFRMVCLLGMNDGDYPRTRKPADFDLMETWRRPGDRTRRDDDRYLFLEALLSARERLYVSWVGRDIRDNSVMPPSVLVGQLRDEIAAGWVARSGRDSDPRDAGVALLDRLTVEHPLQPFSREYFSDRCDRIWTFAHEWGRVWQPDDETDVRAELPPCRREYDLTLHELAAFLRQPVQAFMQQRLRARLSKAGEIGPPAVDEPFSLNGLERWTLRDELVRHLIDQGDSEDAEDRLRRYVGTIRQAGRLPLHVFGDRVEAQAIEEALDIGRRWFDALADHPEAPGPLRVHCQAAGSSGDEVGPIRLEDWLTGLRSAADGSMLRVELVASKLIGSSAKSVTQANARWDKLVGAWPAHLAGCAMGLDLTTRLIGLDVEGTFAPVAPDAARADLQQMMAAWQRGMSAPLPVAPALSGRFLYLQAKGSESGGDEWLGKAWSELRKQYEEPTGFGDSAGPALRDREPALGRLFPDFGAMWDRDPGDDFRHWSRVLYQSLVQSQGGR